MVLYGKWNSLWLFSGFLPVFPILLPWLDNLRFWGGLMGKKEMPQLKHSADRSAIIWGCPSGFPGIRTRGQGASGGCSRAGAPSLTGVTCARRAANLQDFPQLKRSSAEEGWGRLPAAPPHKVGVRRRGPSRFPGWKCAFLSWQLSSLTLTLAEILVDSNKYRLALVSLLCVSLTPALIHFYSSLRFLRLLSCRLSCA